MLLGMGHLPEVVEYKPESWMGWSFRCAPKIDGMERNCQSQPLPGMVSLPQGLDPQDK